MLSTLFNLLFAFDKKQGASLCFESLKTQRTPYRVASLHPDGLK